MTQEEPLQSGVGNDEPRAPLAHWLTLAALIATIIFAFMNARVLTLVAAPMATDLGLSDTQLGLVQGLAFTVFTVLAVYPIGWLADRVDRRLVLAACILVWSLGVVASAFAADFTQLFVAVIAIAAGEAGLSPIVLSAVPDLFSGRQRVTANLVYYAATVLGISLGFFLGGMAIGLLDGLQASLPVALQRLEPWRLAFLLVASPAPLFIALTTVMRLGGTTKQVRVRPEQQDLRPYLGRHGRAFGLVMAFMATYTLAFGGIMTWLPVAMVRRFDISLSDNGIFTGVALALGAITGIALASQLMRRVGPRFGPRAALRLLWIVILIAAPTSLLLPMAMSPHQAYAILALQMCAGTLVGSLMPNVVQDIAPPPLRARLFALQVVIVTPLAGLSIVAIGKTSDLLGGDATAIVWAITAFAVPAWLLSAVLARIAETPVAATVAVLQSQRGCGAAT